MAKAPVSKYRIMKFDGDDTHSHAVFRKEDVKGMTSPVCWGEAKPLVSSCTRSEAKGYKDMWDRKDAKKLLESEGA